MDIRITELPDRIRDLRKIDDAHELDLLIDHQADRASDVARTVVAAADSLLEVHAATGIDLTQAPAWLALVRLAYPDLTIEGTGDALGVYRTTTETGWFSITGG